MVSARKKRYKINKRFYLIVATVLAIIVSAVYFLVLAPRYDYLTQGEISFVSSFEGVVVRSETVYEATNFGNFSFVAYEGERVKPGDKVVEVYKWGYNDKTMSDLIEVRQQIMDYQINTFLSGIVNVNLENLNKSISEKTEEIRKIVTGEYDGNLIAAERELNSLLEEKRNYIKTAVPLDNNLTVLYEKEANLVEKINGWKVDVFADREAAVSFYFDGNESIFTPENIEKMSIKNIKTAINKTYKSNVDSTSVSVYRLIDPNKWYVAAISPKEVTELSVGSMVDVVFNEAGEKQYSATVSSIREDKDGYVYMLHFMEDIGTLISDRKVNISTKSTTRGLRVPSAAVKSEGNNKFIQIKSANGFSKVFVTVLAEQNGKAIIASADPSVTLSENIQVKY